MIRRSDNSRATLFDSSAYSAFSWGGGVALGVPVVAVWLLEGWGVGSLAGVLSILQRIDFLVAATVLGSLAYVSVKIVRQR